jgi:hypothetical protein
MNPALAMTRPSKAYMVQKGAVSLASLPAARNHYIGENPLEVPP